MKKVFFPVLGGRAISTYSNGMLHEADRARDFPSLEEMVYLNTAAEGIPPVSAGEALQRYHSHKFGDRVDTDFR